MRTVRYICIALVMLSLTAHAATFVWDGDLDRAWMDAANWDPDGVPSSGNDYVANFDTIDPALEDFAGDSLTLNGSGAILRYTDEATAWRMNILTNNAGIIRVQHADRSVTGIITNLTLAGAARFLIDDAGSSLTLNIDTLTFASGAAPYKYDDGALVLTVGNISASNGDVFRMDGGTLDFDGTADTQVMGLNITGGQYVLDEARDFASLTVDGMSFGAGTYTYTDFQAAGKDAFFADAGGSITVGAISGSEVIWDGGAADSSRWGTAANWNPDTAPNSSDDFVFTGNSISVLSGDMTAKTLIGGDVSTLRVRSSGLSLHGDLQLVGTNVFWRYVETGEKTVSFAVAGSATVGGDGFRFLVDQDDDTVTFNIQSLILQASSKIEKQGSGNLTLNATSFNANGNTIEVDSGKLTLDGAADYSELFIDVTGATSSGKFVVGTNSVTLAGLTIEGAVIDRGVYAPGDDIYTTYSDRLLNEGGTLTVGTSSTVIWDDGAGDSSRWGTAANWNPDTVPNSIDDFDFTGNSISALGGDMTAKTLIGGDASTLRMRSAGVSLSGDLQMVGTNVFWRYIETGEMTVSFAVDGSATVGGDGFRFMVDQDDDTVTFNIQSLILQAASKIEKQGSGDLILNATSFNANGNTIEVDSGKLTLDGAADYSGLFIDVTGAASSGKFVVGTTSVTLAGLIIEGAVIDSGVYGPGDDLYTTHSDRLLNEGGTLTVGSPAPTEIGEIGLQLGGASAVFSWNGDAAGSYVLQCRESLVDGEWSNVVENISGVDGAMSATNDTSLPQAFYRIIVE